MTEISMIFLINDPPNRMLGNWRESGWRVIWMDGLALGATSRSEIYLSRERDPQLLTKLYRLKELAWAQK